MFNTLIIFIKIQTLTKNTKTKNMINKSYILVTVNLSINIVTYFSSGRKEFLLKSPSYNMSNNI